MAASKAQDERPRPQQQGQREAPRVTGAYFPLGYKDAVYQWWNSVAPPMTERAVLSMVPHLKEGPADGSATSPAADDGADPHGHRVWRSSMVQLSGKNRALNEYSVERVGEEADETLVMLHGYGAGLGFFYKNFEPLTRQPGWRLFALDMLGMGNSSRPHFKVHARDADEKIREAESWFVDALEEWRRIRRIDRFTLLGHSLGGYLAVAYALKYPGHLNKLILASPVGIPEDPFAVDAELPEPSESTMEAEFTQDQQSTTSDNNNFLNARDKAAAAAAAGTAAGTAAGPKTNAAGAPKRPLPSWLVWLWDANVSPFSIVRMTGPLGPRFVSGWTSRRFNHLPPDEQQALHNYSFGLFRQKGSGEYALPYLLAPGAFARSPIINRIHEVGRQPIPPSVLAASSTAASAAASASASASASATTSASASGTSTPNTSTNPSPASSSESANEMLRETGIPIVMMYGENDWMDAAGGFAAEERLKEARLRALLHGTDYEKRHENGSAKVIIISKAGHHLYLDNADEFNEVMREELQETQAESQRRRRAAA